MDRKCKGKGKEIKRMTERGGGEVRKIRNN
jgi:hypothetical protein